MLTKFHWDSARRSRFTRRVCLNARANYPASNLNLAEQIDPMANRKLFSASDDPKISTLWTSAAPDLGGLGGLLKGRAGPPCRSCCTGSLFGRNITLQIEYNWRT